MGKLKAKFMRFMYGRYGSDKLSYALLICYIILIVINAFVGSWILNAVALVPIIWSIYRMFSKKIARRRAENAVFERILGAVTGFFRLQFDRLRDIKTHRYRKCRNCGAVLRLPR
ncbi:MAG: hypothetical protein WCQ72_05255, partial [Eubacteriales bacterium]